MDINFCQWCGIEMKTKDEEHAHDYYCNPANAKDREGINIL